MLRKLAVMVGLAPIFAGAALLAVPGLQTRVEGIPRRVETWWAEQQPHDMYVPAPAEVAAGSGLTAAPSMTGEPSRQVTPSPVTAQPSQTPTQAASMAPVATTAPTRVAPTSVAIAPAPPELKLT